jgi:hypothetical protein
VNIVRHSINVTIKRGVATVGLHLEFVLYVLKTPGCVGCIGIGFKYIDLVSTEYICQWNFNRREFAGSLY